MFFHSRDIHCKVPYGAVATGTAVRLHFYLPTDFHADSISVICQYDLTGESRDIPMTKGTVLPDCTVFSAEVPTSGYTGLVFYYFSIVSGGYQQYCGDSLRKKGGPGFLYTQIPPAYRFTVYDAEFSTPDWFSAGVTYQIFPDRFCALEPKNPDGKFLHVTWNALPAYLPNDAGKITNSDFFGGNLRGIIEKLPYLASLSVKTIYLNPIFQARSNHRYDTGDYKKIDPMLGSEADFIALCDSAHALGMKVLLDGVFSHTGDDSLYFNKYGSYDSIGAYQSPDSPYYDWYTFEQYPDKYQCWWGIVTLPQVSEEQESFVRYILTDEDSVVRHWLSLGADGFRLDVADELPDSFIETMRTVLKEEKPDALLLGEVWEDASDKIAYSKRRQYFYGKGLDGVMNYPFRDALLTYLTEGYAEHFVEDMECLFENYPPPAHTALMNFFGTHDTVRILTALGFYGDSERLLRDGRAVFLLPAEAYGAAKKLLILGAALMMTFLGSPTIYYGDEVGLQGFEDPFNRRTYPYGSEDFELLTAFQRLGAIRAKYLALQRGTLSFFLGHMDAVGYIRRLEDEEIVVLINRGEWDYIAYPPIEAGQWCDLISGDLYVVDSAVLIPKKQALILVRKD